MAKKKASRPSNTIVEDKVQVPFVSYTKAPGDPKSMLISQTNVRSRLYEVEDWAVDASSSVELLIQVIQQQNDRIIALEEQVKGILTNV